MATGMVNPPAAATVDDALEIGKRLARGEIRYHRWLQYHDKRDVEADAILAAIEAQRAGVGPARIRYAARKAAKDSMRRLSERLRMERTTDPQDWTAPHPEYSGRPDDEAIAAIDDEPIEASSFFPIVAALQMTRTQWDAVKLLHWGSMTYRAAAVKLGISVPSIQSRVKGGLRAAANLKVLTVPRGPVGDGALIEHDFEQFSDGE